jgi:outer membrane protein OmpA-like peptidoglycan-associated protein
MSLRGTILGVVAMSMLAVAGGCSDTVKDQRDALLKQNEDLTKQNEALRAQNSGLEQDLGSARTAAAGAGKTGTIDTGTGAAGGSDVIFSTPPAKGAGTGSAGKAGVTARSKEEKIEISADVLFDSGKSTLKPEAKKELDGLVAKLKNASHVTIEGHTDNIPFKKTSTMTNEKLGQNRANAVVAYLVSKGVPKSHLTAVSKADKEPISKTNQAANRRVTFLVTN